jgi:hypothetical protein
MKILSAVAVVLTCASAAFPADKIQPLDVKLGQWETTTTSQVSGAPPIPADAMARLTPEQRARMEAAMNRAPHTQTRKSCLKKEDLEKGATFGQDRKNCARTVLTSTSSKMDVRLQCDEGDGMKTNATLKVEALNSENVKGAVEAESSGGGNKMNMKSNFTAKWLGPVCGKTD